MEVSSRSAPARRKIVFVVNHAAFFVSHRLPIAIEALRRGDRVELITGQAGSDTMERAAEAALTANGIPHIRVAFTSSGVNPFVELHGLVQLCRVLRRIRPDLVHCASPKGILYGGTAARVTQVPALVLAVSGMGFAFSEPTRRNLPRSMIASIYRLLMRVPYGHPNKRVIVQNRDDLALLKHSGLARDQDIALIPGSGVDLDHLGQASIEAKEQIVLFPARMIYDKGVLEFVGAARLLKREFPSWRFVMAGVADYRNPASVPREQLEGFQREGVIEWLDHVQEMGPVYHRASIVCLPSYYGEGLPKSLLEAAACGCAVVTADTTGCREAILPGITGTLVPPRTVAPLAEALRDLITDRSRRDSYGRAGCKLAAERFGVRNVVQQIMDLYGVLLGNVRR